MKTVKMSENQEDLKFNLTEDSGVQAHFKSDQDDFLKQIIGCNLFSVKTEELDHDSFQFTDTRGIVKEEPEEEPMLMDDAKSEPETKPLLENSDSIDDTMKMEEIYIKSELPEEEYIQDSTLSDDTIQKRYEDATSHLHYQCSSGTRQDNYLSEKLTQKSAKKKTIFKCKQRSFTTRWKSGRNEHSTKHSDPQVLDRFHCEHCDYKTVRKNDMNKHLLMHQGKKRHVCTHCDFQAVQRGNLTRHLLIHKNAEELDWFRCAHCDYQTLRKNDMNKHLPIHKGDKKHVCKHCDFQTVQRGNLKRHLLTHKNAEELEWFRCAHCDYQTIRKYKLIDHLNIHKDSQVLDWLSCQHCDYKTIRKRGLKSHLLTHIPNEKRHWFQCGHCDYKAIRKYELKRHSIVHQDLEVLNRWFHCEHCNYKTIRRSNLKQHSSRCSFRERT